MTVRTDSTADNTHGGGGDSSASVSKDNGKEVRFTAAACGIGDSTDEGEDDTPELPEDSRPGVCKVSCRYVAALSAGSIFVSATAIGMWSSMGMGQVVMDRLSDNSWLWYPATAGWCGTLALLLALDFFRPPHLPESYMRLWETDYFVGRGLLGFAIGCFWMSLIFLADAYPSIPLVTTVMLEPLLFAVIRLLLKKEACEHLFTPEKNNSVEGEPESLARSKQRLRASIQLARMEADSGRFYCSAMVAFLVAAVASLFMWLAWLAGGGNYLSEVTSQECIDGYVAPVECKNTFEYQGETYSHCTQAGGASEPWCSHAEVFVGAWSSCLECEVTMTQVWVPFGAASCSWSSTATSGYVGSADTTEEQCQEFCGAEDLCASAVYYADGGCPDDACSSDDGELLYRCRLASACRVGGEGGGEAAAEAALPANAVVYNGSTEITMTLPTQAQDELYILWSAPLVIALSNVVFAMFAGARVFFHSTYSATADLVSEDVRTTDRLGPRRASVAERAEQQRKRALRQMSMIVRLVLCSFLFFITLFWITGQLLYADSQIAVMVLGLLGAFFAGFVLFTALSFKRVARHLWEWMAHLPIWRTARSIARSDWTKALGLCVMLPVIPIICLLSMLNQAVRKARSLYDQVEPGKSREKGVEGVSPKDLLLTPRVHLVITESRKLDRLSIIAKCFVLCGLMFAYTTCPVALNVFLAWFNKALIEMDLEFSMIVVITFVTGILAFLLPPVPGLTIYVFGGLMMSSTCPDGFWAGAAINIGLGWGLKLTACAIQQKIIGGLLGRSLWVRKTCGVHKVAIRCIEAELRRPGWTIGKLAILCGGPDWPVSVLAGILDLSLFQCELGTLPIIFFIIPCSLSGSFYIKRGTSEVWTNSGNLMLVASVLISGILWVIAGWAMQTQLEKNYEELMRPLPQNVDLEWLDYRDKEISKAVVVRWSSVPKAVRFAYAFCALAQIMVCHAFYFAFSTLFNSFEVSDSIERLKSWYGDEGVVTSYGVLALGVFFLSWLGLILFHLWSSFAMSGARKEAARGLNQREAAWKEEWLASARNWKPPERGDAASALKDDPAPLAQDALQGARKGIGEADFRHPPCD